MLDTDVNHGGHGDTENALGNASAAKRRWYLQKISSVSPVSSVVNVRDQNPTRNPKSNCQRGLGPSSARIAAISTGNPMALTRSPPPKLLIVVLC